MAILFLMCVIVSFAIFGGATAVYLRIAKAYNPVVVEMQEESIAQPNYRLVRTVKVVASAYSSHPAQTDDTPCITANGFDVCKNFFETQQIDTIAANGLRMGTVVKFPKLYPNSKFVVRDRMNPRYGYNYVDIWLPNRLDAKVFGRRFVEMEIYEPVD